MSIENNVSAGNTRVSKKRVSPSLRGHSTKQSGLLSVISELLPASYLAVAMTENVAVIVIPQGEAIHARTLDCFTLRVRNEGRDNLNCLKRNRIIKNTAFHF
jgi:hypothetical protein